MPFNFTKSMRVLCVDICSRLPVFAHVDMSKVGISFSQTKNKEQFGVFASLTPLKFQDGQSVQSRDDGSYWRIPEIRGEDKKPVLYILTFCVPRFIDLPLKTKFITTVHELYHIGQRFDGDIRRFGGRCYAHGTSRKKYDAIVEKFADEWLAKDPPPEIWGFMKLNFKELVEKYQGVCGTKYRIPCAKRMTAEEVRQYLAEQK